MVMSAAPASGRGRHAQHPDRNSMAMAFGRARAQLLCPCRLADRERIESASERGARLCSLCALRARASGAERRAESRRAAAPPRRRFLFYEFRLGANDGDVGGAGVRYGVDMRNTPIATAWPWPLDVLALSFYALPTGGSRAH